jgi:adenine deaminase
VHNNVISQQELLMSKTNFRLIDTRALVDCAMGREPADLVVKNGKWVCVQSGEIIPDTDIAVKGERIAYIGPDASHTIGEKTEVIEAKGRFLVPGLLDAHMHVESGMVTVTEFVRAVISHGTTGMFIDPHEIGNVFGLDGVKLMVDEAAVQPIHVFVQVPSCVPAAPGFETPGAMIGPEEVEEALKWPGVIGLGEVMNFPGVFNNEETMHAKLQATRRERKVIGGHYPSLDLGIPFHGYVAGGAQDDHEGTRVEDAISRVRQGMRIHMRYGSAWLDVAQQVKAVTEKGLDSRYFILCTDDSHSETLTSEGHMDRVIRHAIGQGLAPIKAIEMATINTAEHFGLSQEMGLLAPRRFADIVLVSDLDNFKAEVVIAKGKKVSENGQVLIDIPSHDYPHWAVNSVKLDHEFTAKDFFLAAPDHKQTVQANVIGVIENQAPTKHMHFEMHVSNGGVSPDITEDLAKIAVVERHNGKSKVQVGLVHGFGFKEKCAIASTVAHDCHQLIVVGTDETQMALAVNKLAEIQGGQVVFKDGELIGCVELRIAGLMSDKPAVEVARQARSVLAGFKQCGCVLNNPNMQLSLLALSVIPDLRITDKGLMNVNQFEFIPVIY